MRTITNQYILLAENDFIRSSFTYESAASNEVALTIYAHLKKDERRLIRQTLTSYEYYIAILSAFFGSNLQRSQIAFDEKRLYTFDDTFKRNKKVEQAAKAIFDSGDDVKQCLKFFTLSFLVQAKLLKNEGREFIHLIPDTIDSKLGILNREKMENRARLQSLRAFSFARMGEVNFSKAGMGQRVSIAPDTLAAGMAEFGEVFARELAATEEPLNGFGRSLDLVNMWVYERALPEDILNHTGFMSLVECVNLWPDLIEGPKPTTDIPNSRDIALHMDISDAANVLNSLGGEYTKVALRDFKNYFTVDRIKTRDYRRLESMIIRTNYISRSPAHTMRFGVGAPLEGFSSLVRDRNAPAIQELIDSTAATMNSKSAFDVVSGIIARKTEGFTLTDISSEQEHLLALSLANSYGVTNESEDDEVTAQDLRYQYFVEPQLDAVEFGLAPVDNVVWTREGSTLIETAAYTPWRGTLSRDSNKLMVDILTDLGTDDEGVAAKLIRVGELNIADHLSKQIYAATSRFKINVPSLKLHEGMSNELNVNTSFAAMTRPGADTEDIKLVYMLSSTADLIASFRMWDVAVWLSGKDDTQLLIQLAQHFQPLLQHPEVRKMVALLLRYTGVRFYKYRQTDQIAAFKIAVKIVQALLLHVSWAPARSVTRVTDLLMNNAESLIAYSVVKGHVE
jgi:hypothetical protein